MAPSGGIHKEHTAYGKVGRTKVTWKILLIHRGYYTGSGSVRLDIFTSLTYSVESGGRDRIQGRVQIYSRTEQIPV